jgi:AcrR family transcriptional regulator
MKSDTVARWKPLGRRAGRQNNRETILASARGEFAVRGYEGATIRRIAARAGIDPALIHQFFGTKEELMLAAFRPRAEEKLPELLSGDRRRLGERLIRTTFEIYGSEFPDGWATMIGLLRSATSNERAARLLRESFQRGGIAQLVKAMGLSRPALRLALISSVLFGLTLARFVVQMPPIDKADVESVVSWYGPALDHYLTGHLE